MGLDKICHLEKPQVRLERPTQRMVFGFSSLSGAQRMVFGFVWNAVDGFRVFEFVWNAADGFRVCLESSGWFSGFRVCLERSGWFSSLSGTQRMVFGCGWWIGCRPAASRASDRTLSSLRRLWLCPAQTGKEKGAGWEDDSLCS